MSEKQKEYEVKLVCVIASFAIVVAFGSGFLEGRKHIIRQIAEGTHKVEHTTNDFGTVEWRIVEVEKGSE